MRFYAAGSAVFQGHPSPSSTLSFTFTSLHNHFLTTPQLPHPSFATMATETDLALTSFPPDPPHTPLHRLTSVLVIGGCGFLGHHVVRQLLSYHPTASLHVLDLRTNINRFPGVIYHTGDITSRESVDAIIAASKPQIVINTVSPIAGLPREVMQKVNVEGTRTTLEASRDAGVKGFVWTSSASVCFDGQSDTVNQDETAPFPEVHMDGYNETKAEGERIVLEANRKGGMLTCALRLSGLFGEGDRQMLPGMLGVLRDGKTKFQIGDNTNLFDFTYIGNSAYSHILAAEHLALLSSRSPLPPKVPYTTSGPYSYLYSAPATPAPPTVDGETFIITNTTPIPFWDFPRAIWALKGHVQERHVVFPKGFAVVLGAGGELAGWLMGKEPSFTRFKVKFSCWNRYFGTRKAREVLGYSPLWDLQEGLERSVKWLEQEELKKEKESSEKKGQ